MSAADPPVQPEAPVELRGDLDARTIISGVLVAVIMGASYPYMVLKLGFGPNVSVVAAFFGFLLLRLFEIATRRKHYDRWQNNLAEAAGTSAAQTAFMCILLGGFDILRHSRPDIFSLELSPIKSFAWLSVACTLGVLVAVPLRRHFVVDEKLPYADGLAASETLIVMDPPREASDAVKRNALAAFRAVVIGVALSGLLMLIRDDSKLIPLIPEGWDVPWHYLGHGIDHFVKNDAGVLVPVWSGVVLANLGVGAQYSMLNIGSGMIVGLRINISMLLGGVFAWIVAPYFLVAHQVPLHHVEVAGVVKMVFSDTPTRNEILFWVMWPATGMLVVGGLTALVLRWRLLVETFRSLRTARIGSTEFPLKVVGIGSAVLAVALCIVQRELLGMPVWMTAAAIVLSLPLMLVGLRVLGETNWGPISALSNMMQGVFAAISPGNVAANMVASGTTGTVATSSEAIMQDYKCGHVIGTKPRNITIMQLIAVPIGAAAVSWVYPLLVKTYGIFDRVDAHGRLIKAELTSPVSNKWSGFAQVLKDGAHALPTSALYAAILFSALGVVLTVLEAKPSLRKWVPSPTGVGIGILVGFNVVFVMALGGVIGWAWERWHKKSADVYLLPLASGLIAGEAIVAVFGSLYLAATG